MKKILISIVVLLSSSALFAQTSPRTTGYYSSNQKFKYDESKKNMPMKGYYVLKDGTEVEAILAYREPEWLIGPFAAGASLVVCKELTGTPVNVFNPDSEPNFKEYIKKDAIKGFFIDGHLYGNVPNTGWAIVLSEGAIRSFINVVKLKTNSGIQYASFEQTQKLGGKAYGSAFGTASISRLKQMIADAPEIAEEVKNGSLNIYQAIRKYNEWYDANNPGKIDYILGADGLTKAEEASNADAEVQRLKAAAAKKKAEEDQKIAEEARAAQNKILNEARKKAENAPNVNYFDGRPATVSASIASAKPEVKVKKEKFKARIDRIKADGNKVGIVVWCGNVIPKTEQDFPSNKTVKVYGSFEPLEDYTKWADVVAEKLNSGFSTDVFEVVDLTSIPAKEVDGIKMDDWWSTKYKMILKYNFRPYYNAYTKTTTDSSKTITNFYVRMKVDMKTHLSAAEDATQSRLKSAGFPPKLKPFYSIGFYEGTEGDVVHTMQELKALINPPSDAEIINSIISLSEPGLDKFIKKQIKKSKK